jgi:hypothetical protein
MADRGRRLSDQAHNSPRPRPAVGRAGGYVGHNPAIRHVPPQKSLEGVSPLRALPSLPGAFEDRCPAELCCHPMRAGDVIFFLVWFAVGVAIGVGIVLAVPL